MDLTPSLQDEVVNLKNNLVLKAQEIKSLRIRNSSLETMISSLDKRGIKSDSSASPKIVDYPEISFNRKEQNTNNELCELDFEAVVTALNGKSKEAFYTEFFLIKNDIETALRNGGINLKNYSGVDSYSELWARSRKNAFLFPGVQKEIRSVLLALVEEGEGKRIRTDVDGAARFRTLPKEVILSLAQHRWGKSVLLGVFPSTWTQVQIKSP